MARALQGAVGPGHEDRPSPPALRRLGCARLRPDGAPLIEDEELLAEQLAYYEARAPEYDHWFYRSHRYDRGPESTAQWNAEVATVRDVLATVEWRGRHVVELAPGTGIWTEWLLDQGARVSVVDGSPAMVGQMRARLGERARDVEVTIADLFAWEPTQKYDGLFAGFFLSHVPRNHFDEFWATIASAVCIGGVIGFVDSRRVEESTARDHVLPTAESEISERRLDDGREFRVVKNYYEPDEFATSARASKVVLSAQTTTTFFVVGTGIVLGG